MESKNRNVFWQAFVLAVLIFGLGMLLGYVLELNRTSTIITLYQQTELDLMDNKIQDNIISLKTIDCNGFFDELINFANGIYEQAKLLDKYDEANQLSQGIILQHKKYDLMRTDLWVNSIKLKEKCNSSFDTLVYFYEYDSKNLNTKSEQQAFSSKLSEIKSNMGNRIILIPIAGNLNMSSINYLMRVYNVTSLPAIIINEKFKIDSLEGLKEIENHLK